MSVVTRRQIFRIEEYEKPPGGITELFLWSYGKDDDKGSRGPRHYLLDDIFPIGSEKLGIVMVMMSHLAMEHCNRVFVRVDVMGVIMGKNVRLITVTHEELPIKP